MPAAPPEASPSARRPKVVLLGGDGIGPEVVEATAGVLERLAPSLELVRPPHGEAAVAAGGEGLPAAAEHACREADAILFGACHRASLPVLRFLRWGLETYANLRPARSLPGLASPLADDRPLDLLVVRENLEGEYPGREGEMAELVRRWPELRDNLGRPLSQDGLFTVRVTTEEGSRRVARVAAREALARRERGLPGRVTVVTKANILRRTDGLFRDIAFEELERAGVEHDHLHVDDACRRLVAGPHRLDVLLCPNLFGDVVSDVAAELVGGIGMAPSGCLGDRHAYFESVHGSAPDIAGRGVANPLSTVLSAAMLLEHVGLAGEAARLTVAVEDLLVAGRPLTPDLGGEAGTEEVAAALVERL